MPVKNVRDKKEINSLSEKKKHHIILILILAGVIIFAIVAQFLVRPDRKATLKVFYTGDIQGRMEYKEGENAGYEKIDALVQHASEQGDHVILLDAGNCLGGNEISEIDDGESVITMMNAVGYDAMVPGAMDFVYGATGVSSLRSQAAFPMLAANIKNDTGKQVFENYKIITVNSVRIGLIGITNGLSQKQAQRESLTVEDPIETVKNVIQSFPKKVDAVIVLANTGDQVTIDQLVKIPGVSVVITSAMTDGSYEKKEGQTFVLSPGKYAQKVGVATIHVDHGDVNIENEFLDAKTFDTYATESDIKKVLTTADHNMEVSKNRVAGVLNIEMPDYTGNEIIEKETDSTDIESEDIAETEIVTEDNTVRIARHQEETAFGDYITNAMLNAASTDQAEIALIEDTSILMDLQAGSVTKGQICDVFDDTQCLVTCKMTGGELRTLIEKSFDNYPKSEKFLQVAGISYEYKVNKGIGSALSNVMVGSHPIDDAKIYTVAMTNTLADSLGYYSASSGRIGSYNSMAMVLFHYISMQEQASDATDTVLSVENEKRIQIIE